MLRTRLAVAAAFTLTFLPGCGLLCGDRGWPWGRQTECLRGGPMMEAIPVSYPVTNGGCCTPIPSGGPIVAGPIVGGPYGGGPYGGPIMGGPVYGNGLSETLPPPLAQPGAPPRIPKIGIDEGKGKQFELEGASKSGPGGPVLAIPATGAK